MQKNLSYFLLGNIEMAKISTEKLIDISPDAHFVNMLKDDLKEYDAFYTKVKNQKSPADEVKNINPFVKFSTEMSMTFQTFDDKSNRHLSKMLIDGFNMGIRDADENIKKAKELNESESMIKIAKDYRQLLVDNVRKYENIT